MALKELKHQIKSRQIRDIEELIDLNLDLMEESSKIDNPVRNKEFLETYQALLEAEIGSGLYTDGLIDSNDNLFSFLTEMKKMELSGTYKSQRDEHFTKIERDLIKGIFSLEDKMFKDKNYDYEREFTYLNTIHSFWELEKKNKVYKDYMQEFFETYRNSEKEIQKKKTK